MTNADDADLAVALARSAGELLLRLRQSGLENDALRHAGDAQSNDFLLAALTTHRPNDSVLSEEAVDDRTRLDADRVWIIDPLDGTREYGLIGRSDWAVHVALWERGHEITAAAVALPAQGRVHVTTDPRPTTTTPDLSDLIILVSDSRPPAFAPALAEAVGGRVQSLGSAGAKAMAVLHGEAGAYVHAGGQREWDSAAPVGVLLAAGFHASRLDGSALRYNQPDPYLPDLLICRTDLAAPLLSAVRPSIRAVTTGWDPQQYLRFGNERERPFWDLLARILHPDPKVVIDLGCGPGTTTAHIVERWPHARVVGIDNSAEMIADAQTRARPGQLEFRPGDLRDWKADVPVDVLVTCATLQWVPDHQLLLPGFMASLAPGGSFAFQVPGNFVQPSHTLLYELATSDRWTSLLSALVRPSPVLEPAAYLEALLATGAEADVWETTYLHVLTGPDAVFEWVRGTALRPFLTTLETSGSPGDVEEFTAAYTAVLRAAYPRDHASRTLFPFRRIFGVATVKPALS